MKSSEAAALSLLETVNHLIFKDGLKFFAGLSDEKKELICREADEQRLGPLLYFYCHKDNLLPAQWKNKFAADFRDASAAELIRANELKKILRLLTENQISAVLLKGAALAYKCYPHPALRPMCDFDIIINPDNITRAWELMRDNNFKTTHIPSCHHMPMLFSPNGQAVELHSHICNKMSFPQEYFQDEVLDTSVLGYEAGIFSPELNILHAVSHAMRDNLVCGFKLFIDTAFIIINQKPAPEKLLKLAVKLKQDNQLILIINTFPDFFPPEYRFPPKENIDSELEMARFMILNAKHIQKLDKKVLMLSREYTKRSKIGRYLFIFKKCVKNRRTLEYKYKRQINPFTFSYYYFKEVSEQFRKLMDFNKTASKNTFITSAGKAQRLLRKYLCKKPNAVVTEPRKSAF